MIAPARTPRGESWDGEIVFLGPAKAPEPWLFVKTTWTSDGDGGLGPGPALPLAGTVPYGAATPGGMAALTDLPGSDFVPLRGLVDLLVRGHAYAPDPGVTREMAVRVMVNDKVRHMHVCGRRVVRWVGSRPEFPDPEPFERVALTWENAYGGIDRRYMPLKVSTRQLLRLGLGADHPGAYPRNPVGKGYVVLHEPLEGLELPQVERTHERLTPERLVPPAPEAWHRQPRPACLDAVSPVAFPRNVLFNPRLAPWYPPPEDDSVFEIRSGWLPRGRLDMACPPGKPPPPLPGFFQDAGPGFALKAPRVGQPVVIEGMHPEVPAVRLAVPPPPEAEISAFGRERPVSLRLLRLEAHPNHRRLTATFAARVPTPGLVLPGIHQDIPLRARIDGGSWFDYQAPEPIPPLRAKEASR